ncbi:MAG: ATP-binding protein [Oscillospiraceae bacterium]|nr:ATP-binding protein [Oscillospiraceae bacterium]
MAVMIDRREERLYGIKLRLGAYAANAYMEQGRLSESEESLMEGLLNIILDSSLKNMNLEESNFPAIDLGDDKKKLAVQVTSTGTREKVRHTLKEFFENGLEKRFRRLIVVVVGRAERFKTAPTVPGDFDFQPKRDIWDLAGLLREIRRLPERKLNQVEAYLRERVNLPQREERLKLPLSTSLEDGRFVGREDELELIAGRFDREHVVALTGLGGMGKTELAIRFGRDHWFGRTYFVKFRRDWVETVVYGIADGIDGFKRENREIEEIYDEVMAVLGDCGSDELLILDNADRMEESFDQLWQELSKLDIRVLITTRDDVRGASEIVPMDNETLYALFDQHGAKVSRENMDALITAVRGHTLTVDLMARLLHRERRSDTCRVLLDALNKRDLEHTEFGVVAAAFPGASSQARVNEHLKAVFRVSDMTDAEQAVLRFGALLPDCGLDSRLFTEAAQNALRPTEPEQKRGFLARLFGKKKKTAQPAGIPKVSDLLKDLADRGWLDWEGDLLRIHPVIRLVCIEELSPTVETCQDFLQWFRGQYDQTTYDGEKFAQIASLYETASEVLKETDGEWIVAAGYLWLVLVEPRRALTCNHRAVDLREQNAPGSPELGISYDNLGSAYSNLGEYGKALEYKLKALEIKEQVLPPTHPELTTSYNNMGTTYGALGDHEKALEYQLKALEIRKQVLPPTHPGLANSYNNVGCTYGALGDHGKALEYKHKALEIMEQVLPPDHPDLATSYNNVGTTYGALGDHEKALEYESKALEIREQVLPPTHPDLATSYGNVGTTYGALGDHEKELEYNLKALNIQEQVLPSTHPALAQSYNNVGATYSALGDYEKALEYQLKALGIQEQSLPADHPHNVACHNNIAFTYARMDDFIQASEYMCRAVDSAERSMRGHPDLEMYRWGAKEMERCAQCQERGEPFDNPFKRK